MKKLRITLIIGIIFSIILSGCNFPGQETPTSQVDALNTAAAQTIQAQQTSIAQTALATKQEQPGPTQTLSPEPSEEPGSPSATLSPSDTPTTAPTQTPEIECNQAGFVAETIPDGTDYDLVRNSQRPGHLRTPEAVLGMQIMTSSLLRGMPWERQHQAPLPAEQLNPERQSRSVWT